LSYQEENLISHLLNFTLKDCSNAGSNNARGSTLTETFAIGNRKINKFINEYWTSRQRQSSSIHEISYRACFKAQLPRFFIMLLTSPGDLVYDPFSGRGTTLIEAGLLGRRTVANDISPLSEILTRPRLAIPAPANIEVRLEQICTDCSQKADLDLSMFYHPATEAEIVSLKNYLQKRKANREEDDADRWIRMVATNRLTGHSPGFFSVYTLPPNQAVSAQRQVKINLKRNQRPEYRDVKKIITKKTKSLLKKLSPEEIINLKAASKSALFLVNDARSTPEIESEQVSLTVTSPPFLDVVQYSVDNWLRCWFNAIDSAKVDKQITMARSVIEWSAVMGGVFNELFRVTKKGGWVAFEVGEVKRGRIDLEDYVIPLGLEAGFKCPGVLINQQNFTKTSNIWGVSNNSYGTNTNRIVLFHKV
jgi:hypothetical protein